MTWKSYRVYYTELGPSHEVLISARSPVEAYGRIEGLYGPCEIEDIIEIKPRKRKRTKSNDESK